jgi:hypothetical protein
MMCVIHVTVGRGCVPVLFHNSPKADVNEGMTADAKCQDRTSTGVPDYLP